MPGSPPDASSSITPSRASSGSWRSAPSLCCSRCTTIPTSRRIAWGAGSSCGSAAPATRRIPRSIGVRVSRRKRWRTATATPTSWRGSRAPRSTAGCASATSRGRARACNGREGVRPRESQRCRAPRLVPGTLRAREARRRRRAVPRGARAQDRARSSKLPPPMLGVRLALEAQARLLVGDFDGARQLLRPHGGHGGAPACGGDARHDPHGRRVRGVEVAPSARRARC